MIANTHTPPTWLAYVIWSLLVGVVVVHWQLDTVTHNQLLMQVPHPFQFDFLETHWLYFMIHLLPFLPVALMSWDKKVAFYKSFRYVFPALLIVAVPFWAWDIVKTSAEVWGFNPRYYTVQFLHLPIEEWLFFINMPLAILFVYESLYAYFPNFHFDRIERPLSYALVVFFLLVGFANWGRAYTATTFIPTGFFLLWHVLYVQHTRRGRFYATFLVGLLGFLMVNALLTGITTAQPVVVYNPDEYLGLRLWTIPLDDFAYNFLLLLSVITAYHWVQKQGSPPPN